MNAQKKCNTCKKLNKVLWLEMRSLVKKANNMSLSFNVTVNCATCEGQGQIRCFIQLSITWKVNTAEHISERLELPQELIRDVSGQVAFEEESYRVKPVEAFAETEKGIKEASTKLVFEHLNSFSDQKVIKQRHQVRIVPVTKIAYEWKGKLHHYYAYGYEHKVHLPQYPQKCCWGCQIL